VDTHDGRDGKQGNQRLYGFFVACSSRAARWQACNHTLGGVRSGQEISDSRKAAISVLRDLRFVDDGIITSAGVSAGIDMALHVVHQMCGASVAAETAHYMDYKGFACS